MLVLFFLSEFTFGLVQKLLMFISGWIDVILNCSKFSEDCKWIGNLVKEIFVHLFVFHSYRVVEYTCTVVKCMKGKQNIWNIYMPSNFIPILITNKFVPVRFHYSSVLQVMYLCMLWICRQYIYVFCFGHYRVAGVSKPKLTGATGELFGSSNQRLRIIPLG